VNGADLICWAVGHKPVAGRESWKGKENGRLRIRYKDVFCGRCGKPLDRITRRMDDQ